MFLKWNTSIHCYMTLRHEQHCNATWIEVDLNLKLIVLNSNSIEDKWDGKGIENLLISEMLEKNF
jgi:hypothetical protein